MPIYGCDSLCHVHVHDPRSNPNIVNIHCHVSKHDTHIWIYTGASDPRSNINIVYIVT